MTTRRGTGKRGMIQFVILTGTSGGGKSHALDALEDIGYYCVDNLPLALLPTFAELCEQSQSAVSRVALVVDVRERIFSDSDPDPATTLRDRGHRVETLFFDADDAALIRRFSETRRPHPLSPDGSVAEGLLLEREMLTSLRNTADLRVNTSAFSVHDLKDYIRRHFSGDQKDNSLTVSLVAFGYKYGIPLEADLLFDVRFLDNPHFDPELRHKNGRDPQVRAFVMNDPRTDKMVQHIVSMLEFSVPEYDREGRSYLTVGIGCTGGRHRSVAVAEAVSAHLADGPWPIEVRLRDTVDQAKQ